MSKISVGLLELLNFEFDSKHIKTKQKKLYLLSFVFLNAF